MSVLIVADDVGVPGLERGLERADFRVLTSTNTHDALALAQAHRPTLALVALDLPDGGDGNELCRRLRAETLTEVMMLAGSSPSSEERLRSFRAGSVAFYKKPLRPEIVVRDLRFFLEGPRPWRRPPAEQSRNSVLVQAPPALANVLVIDDDEDPAFLTYALGRENLTTFVAATAAKGIMAAHCLRPDAIVLDMMLPDINGAEVLVILKAHGRTRNIPVVVLTGSNRAGLQTDLLRAGASDYFIKSVNDLSALAYKIKLTLGLERPAANVLRGGPVEIDLEARKARIRATGEAPDLSPREFELLAYILARPGVVLPWKEIQRDIWRDPPELWNESSAPETVEKHVRGLRAKLGPAGACLVTHKGRGLMFDPSRTRSSHN